MSCCPIGTNCRDLTDCQSTNYAFNYTHITTTTVTTSSSASPTVFLTTELACSPRACVGSNYLCPASLGGECCGFGQNCGVASGTAICVGVITAEPTTTPVLTIPSGCSVAGQSYCTQGGGCCDAGAGCTYVSSLTAAMCTVNTASSTSSAPTSLPTDATITSKPAGLSTGAKAGIAVGVVVLAALVIGGITYLCLRRHRRRRSTRTTVTSAAELPSVVAAGALPANTNNNNADDRTNPAAPSDNNSIRPYDAASGPHMSEADGYSYGYAASNNTTTTTQPSRGAGAAGSSYSHAGRDYFGPTATATDAILHRLYSAPHDEAGDVTAPVEIGPVRGPSFRRGPVVGRRRSSEAGRSELSAGGGGASDPPSPERERYNRGGPSSPVDSIAGRFELYGDYYGAAGATPGSGQEQVFYDARESVGGGSRVRVAEGEGGAGGGGSSGMLPQPFPTPGSEMSEFATPSPLSREEGERRHSRRDV